ncbi:hypothetical protein LUZ60_001733 [Juncus effusus]|nr:hypothetical protein LUZ60_001733 [Juncus effusus]
MSRNNGKSPRIDLRLNLTRARGGSSSRVHQEVGEQNNNTHNNNNSPRRSSTSSSSGGTGSPASSCVSSDEGGQPGSPGASMVLVGCPRCMMYVMLSEHDPKCPKCKSTVLVDFHRAGKKN